MDLVKGEVRHNLKHGIVEPMISKVKSIKYIYFFHCITLSRFATEAAITILRIDDMIKLEPRKEEMHRR